MLLVYEGKQLVVGSEPLSGVQTGGRRPACLSFPAGCKSPEAGPVRPCRGALTDLRGGNLLVNP
ncbi:hypothetical protein EYF80_020047 [Liparis tanakae]|uniref:Uncharacterized protein n=1 Tax=Liparis tanakae TaxID=230148 RepID=A0A4Z2HXJ0_9TELE|nr:hypothetical protein EYF80_020047 [Liparis tanakae]